MKEHYKGFRKRITKLQSSKRISSKLKRGIWQRKWRDDKSSRVKKSRTRKKDNRGVRIENSRLYIFLIFFGN